VDLRLLNGLHSVSSISILPLLTNLYFCTH
jgi:hypothetical protein